MGAVVVAAGRGTLSPLTMNMDCMCTTPAPCGSSGEEEDGTMEEEDDEGRDELYIHSLVT